MPNNIEQLMVDAIGPILLRSLVEDWWLEPRMRAGSDITALNPRDDMSQLQTSKKDKDKLDPYNHTEDAGTKKTERMIKRYHSKNRAHARIGSHGRSLEPSSPEAKIMMVR